MKIRDKNLYYIGGVVRDEILEKESIDTDLTYVGDAVEFAQNIEGAEILRINKPFGTVKIKYEGKEIDIASTRSESYPQKGHLPVVKEIGCSLKQDVLRRDFTINAMAKSTFNGEITDYTGGLDDIKNKKIRVLHKNSFIDDPTRIVRALKFRVRFGFELEEETKKLQTEYLKNVNYDMSLKRLKKELEETFNLNSQEAFDIFVKEKIYKLISPDNFKLPKFNFEQLIKKTLPKNIWIIYAGQIHGIEKLPLTKKENKIVEDFNLLKTKTYADDFEIYKNFEGASIESIIMFAAVNNKAVQKYFDTLKNIKLNITGNDLKKAGLKPSKDFAKCMDYVLKQKLKNPKMKKTDELAAIKDFLKKR